MHSWLNGRCGLDSGRQLPCLVKALILNGPELSCSNLVLFLQRTVAAGVAMI